jgi:cytoskeletal protein CcmA (bactofilin family)
MFFKRANKIDNRIDTLIGADTRIEGDMQYSGGLRVDGTIKGNVMQANGSLCTLILSEAGSIEGEVTAAKIVINGKITGPVHAGEFIELQTKARIVGDLYYKSLEMHTGAVIEGKLVYVGDNPADNS